MKLHFNSQAPSVTSWRGAGVAQQASCGARGNRRNNEPVFETSLKSAVTCLKCKSN